jgi:hypothetical protein
MGLTVIYVLLKRLMWKVCSSISLPFTCPSLIQFACLPVPIFWWKSKSKAMLGAEHSSHDDEDDDDHTDSRSRSRTKGEKKKEKKRRKKQQEEEGAAASDKLGASTTPSTKTTTKSGEKRKEVSNAASTVGKGSATASASAPPAMLGEELPVEVAAGKGKGKGKNKEEETQKAGRGWTKDQKKLMVILMKQELQTQQQSRELASILLDPFLCPADATICLEADKQGKRYAKAVANPGHGLQAPHLYIFGAVLAALAKMEDATEEEKNCFQIYEKLTLVQRGEVIKVCKLAKVYRETHKKLVFAWGVGPQAQLLRTLVVQKLVSLEGWELKQGKAPAGHLEREIASWLTDMLS